MDLLSSILSSMDKPPVLSSAELERRRKHKEAYEKNKQAQAAALKKFRESIEKIVQEFLSDEKAQKYEFGPMDEVQRRIIRDVAEIAGVVVFSIGDEVLERRVMMYKKEFLPCEEEIACMKRGEVYDPEKARLEEQAKLEDEAQRLKKPEKFTPNHNYKDKYSHLIGTTAAKDAAKRTETNKQYGYVPSENKKDIRSIEQTLADIQSKKRLKRSHPNDDE